MARPSELAPEFKVRAIDLCPSPEGRAIVDVARDRGPAPRPRFHRGCIRMELTVPDSQPPLAPTCLARCRPIPGSGHDRGNRKKR